MEIKKLYQITLQTVAKSLGLKFEKKVNKQLQTDDYSCVMWTCYFLKKRLENANFNPNQIEDSHTLERQIRLETILIKILSSLESKEEQLKDVHPGNYANSKNYKDINRNYFAFFEKYILGLLTKNSLLKKLFNIFDWMILNSLY